MWRKFKIQDLELGLALRLTLLKDTPFNGAVVTSITAKTFIIARPMTWASDSGCCRQPYLYSELIEYFKDSSSFELEVYENDKGELITFST